MILAPIQHPTLRTAVRRAALPEEDVLHSPQEIDTALRVGFPRLVVYWTDEGHWDPAGFAEDSSRVPTLALAPATLIRWENAWRHAGLAVTRIDDSALRLRSLMARAALPRPWAEEAFDDLSRVLGRGLPRGLRGLGRRVMEHPSRYASLQDLARLTGLTPGALKARFRRRDLPSPALYLRWFRLAAALELLGRQGTTTLEASHRLGFSSDGNFCRWVVATSGITPSALRGPLGRAAFLIRFAESCFSHRWWMGWDRLERVFLRRVA